MINLCFISGTIIKEIDFEFIYDKRTKSLSKKHTSIAMTKLKLDNECIVNIQGYDEMADFMYRNMQKSDNILVVGKIGEEVIEIQRIIIRKSNLSEKLDFSV